MNIKLSVGLALLLAAHISNVSATETDCTALKEQAAQATGQQKVELWQQAINECPSSSQMYLHYKHGLALIATNDFTAALKALEQANAKGECKDNDCFATKVAILGRQAQVYLNLNQRPHAKSALNSAAKIAKANQLSLPNWLVDLQKHDDDTTSQQPLSKAEVNTLIARSDKDFFVEPKLDYQITFEENSTTTTSEGNALLQKVIESFQDVTKPILIVGHTDTRGDAAYNQALSEKRANHIKKMLAAQIPSLANKLTTIGKGESEPKYHGNTSDDHQKNRRVEFVFK